MRSSYEVADMEVLVIPPLYFDVVDSYNTRMRPNHPHGRPDKKRTFAQWASMVSILKHDMGIHAVFMNPVPDLHDMAFACDPGLWVDDVFIAGNFWAKPRQPEVDRFYEIFVKGLTDEIYVLAPDAYFEGGDCVMVGKVLLLGYGENRTNELGARILENVLRFHGIEVVPIRRVTEEYYHLNSVLTYYPTAKLLMYYPVAFESNTPDILKTALKDIECVPLPDEAMLREHPDFGGEHLYSYALNAIEHNGKVIQPYCHDIQREMLEKRNLKVIVPEDGSSEFERSGGSYRCLTMIHNITK